MEAEARYTWVGAGVLLLVAALVGGLLWLKNVGREGDFKRFAIHFEQQALGNSKLWGLAARTDLIDLRI